MPIKKLRPDFTFTEDRLRELQQVVPEAFADGKVDWNILREAMGEHLESEVQEHFGLTWPGKREARRLATTPSKGALALRSGEGVNENSARNAFIEGENLEVLKLLQKSYAGRIKMIYIDPPYNTGHDFIYPDNYTEPLESYLRLTGQKDEAGELLTTNARANGRFHSNWLNMILPRLLLARNLLRSDGAIAVSIGEEELAHLTIVLNEVFGEENFRNLIVLRRYDKNLSRQFMENGLRSLSVGTEFVLIYSKGNDFSLNPVFRESSEERQAEGYWKGFWNAPDRPTMRYELLGVEPKVGQWKWQESIALEAVANYKTFVDSYSNKLSLEEYWEQTGKKLRFIKRNPLGKGKNLGVEHWIPPSDGILRTSNWTDILASQSIQGLDLEFNSPKNTSLLKNLILLCSEEDDLILDFFSGSGSTAHAILELDLVSEVPRKFILVQLPEPTEGKLKTIAEIGKERTRKVLKNIHAHNPERTDLGFLSYKLQESNFVDWEPQDQTSIGQIELQFGASENALKRNWELQSLLVEILLLQGFPLDSKVEYQDELPKNQVYRVSCEWHDHYLFVCLDDKVDEFTVANLRIRSEDIFICLDTALSDENKVRLADQTNLHVI